MKKILIDRIRCQNEANDFNSEDQSISFQTDYLLKRIEEKWKELENSLVKDSQTNDEINELTKSKIFLSNINDSSFSLTKILESHKVFQACRTKVVPRTEYLNTFNVKLNDFDYRNLITYSLINNKIYQTFLSVLKTYEPDYKRAKELQEKSEKQRPIVQNLTLDDVLGFISDEIQRTINQSCTFLKQVPGFAELPNEQFSKLLKRGMMDFHLIICSPMFQNGESYLVFENGVNLSRYWLNKMRGKERTKCKIEAAEAINNLKINNREKSLLLVYLYSLPDERLDEFNESLKTLNEFFKRAILYEFDLNGRDPNFVIEFEKVIDMINKNREAHSNNQFSKS